jgi:hypothetical protein
MKSNEYKETTNTAIRPVRFTLPEQVEIDQRILPALLIGFESDFAEALHQAGSSLARGLRTLASQFENSSS